MASFKETLNWIELELKLVLFNGETIVITGAVLSILKWTSVELVLPTVSLAVISRE